LRGGTYGSTTTESDLGKAGTATSRITITAYPGEKPLVKGWINLNGAYTTISHLEIDGSNALYTTQRHTGCPTTASEALTITASGVIFEHNDYYQSIASLRSNGIGVGWWGTADNTVIRYNTIHDVGGCAAYDHLIYLAHGNNVQVYGNWMWNDGHGWGLQIYPGPTNAKVYNNVIDGAGSGMTIGDNGGLTSTGNQAYHNVILNSVGMTTESGYHICGGALTGAAPVAGSNNSFTSNVAYNNPCGIGGETNVAMSANSTANPLFVDAANHDYRLTSSSPAATWGLWDGN
jgi:hypothetical protein